MKKYFIPLILILVIGTFFSSTIFAQDTGEPVFQKVALFTAGGAGAGAVLGFAYFLTDPLADNANVRDNMLIGFAVGAFAGFIFSLNHLARNAVVPGSFGIPPPDIQGRNQYNNMMDYDPIFSRYAESKLLPKIATPLFQTRF